MSLRLWFFGSSEIGIPALEAVAQHHTLVGVVTQPDRPQGRGQRSGPTPIKTAAQRLGQPVLEPASARDPQLPAVLQRARPDLLVVMAYGGILPPALLTIAPHGAWNLHPSLLPRYRGAAPIPWAILNGDAETGLTIFAMDAQVDHGPILAQTRLPIAPEETTATLTERVSRETPGFLLAALARLERGALSKTAQDDRQAITAPRLTKADGWVDWSRPATLIARRARALTPWPGCATTWQGRAVKLVRLASEPQPPAAQAEAAPGTVLQADPSGILVQTGQGAVRIHELQLAGGRPLDAGAFLRGHRIRPDERLG